MENGFKQKVYEGHLQDVSRCKSYATQKVLVLAWWITHHISNKFSRHDTPSPTSWLLKIGDIG
jgi:hypothetical protein